MPLTELANVAPDETPGTRRWFQGDGLELVVWEGDGAIRQYQLRYRKAGADGVFEWRGGRLYHYTLDDGEGRAARVDASPVLRPDGPGDLDWVRARFAEQADRLEPQLRELVTRTLDGETSD